MLINISANYIHIYRIKFMMNNFKNYQIIEKTIFICSKSWKQKRMITVLKWAIEIVL